MCNFLISCGRLGAGHFPAILMFMMVITLAMTYILAVYRKDVSPLFPYISDAGSKRPESCVFGLLLNVAAFMGIIIVYLRYRLVKELNRGSDLVLNRLNMIALIIGCMSSCGMIIVANFQVSAVFAIHLAGAFMCFGSGMIYSICQTAASYRMYPLYNGITICRIRLVISFIALSSFLISVITGSISISIHGKPLNSLTGILLIDEHDPGYWLHITSAITEWTLAFSLLVFMMTYSRDFEKLRVTVAVEPLVAHLDESPPMAPSPEARGLLDATLSDRLR